MTDEEKKPEVAPPLEGSTTMPPPKYVLLIEEYQVGGKVMIRFNNEGFANNFELFGWIKERLPNAETIIQTIKRAGGN